MPACHADAVGSLSTHCACMSAAGGDTTAGTEGNAEEEGEEEGVLEQDKSSAAEARKLQAAAAAASKAARDRRLQARPPFPPSCRRQTLVSCSRLSLPCLGNGAAAPVPCPSNPLGIYCSCILWFTAGDPF